MKLVQIGPNWYTVHEGKLHSTATLDEDKKWVDVLREVGTWPVVTRVTEHELLELTREFGGVTEGLEINADAGLGTQTAAGSVRPIGLESPAIVDKFDTYHAAVIVKEIALEHPAGVDKFDTYHAAVVGKKPEE
jgi:hypothetical protein